jgi:hypothetical protein
MDNFDAPSAADAWELGKTLGLEEAISLALQDSERIEEADAPVS